MTASREQAHEDRLVISMEVGIRRCVREDLAGLEWFGIFAAHRQIIRAIFERQERGEAFMLVAIAGDFPVGQVWGDIVGKKDESVGVLWALRVFPFMRGRGIGTRLMQAAERILVERGFASSEMMAEKWDPRPLRLYQRLNYRIVGSDLIEPEHITITGASAPPLDVWVLRKQLPQPNQRSRTRSRRDLAPHL